MGKARAPQRFALAESVQMVAGAWVSEEYQIGSSDPAANTLGIQGAAIALSLICNDDITADGFITAFVEAAADDDSGWVVLAQTDGVNGDESDSARQGKSPVVSLDGYNRLRFSAFGQKSYPGDTLPSPSFSLYLIATEGALLLSNRVSQIVVPKFTLSVGSSSLAGFFTYHPPMVGERFSYYRLGSRVTGYTSGAILYEAFTSFTPSLDGDYPSSSDKVFKNNLNAFGRHPFRGTSLRFKIRVVGTVETDPVTARLTITMER